MQGENESGVLGNTQVLRTNYNALLTQPSNLGNERMGIDHHPIADDGQLAGSHDAGGKQAQLVADTVDNQSVASIVPTLKAHHHIGALRQPVDDLALALVSPLRADDHHISHDHCSFA